MGRRINLCINTQTPVIRFKLGYSDLMEKYDSTSDSVSLENLTEGVDYDFSPGGVTAMVYPLVKRMLSLGVIADPRWISLGPGAPRVVQMRGIRLFNIALEQRQLAMYANFKEGIWNEIHGFGSLSFKPEEYGAYVTYNWLCAKLMLEMLNDIDVFWIHDFQQLHTGNLIGPSAPAVLRWHIPFRLEGVSERLRTLILKSIEGFDSMIVSTKRDLEGLIHAGYRGRAHAIYPYLDPDHWSAPTPGSVMTTRSKLKLNADDRVLLVVARMDPIKSQDVVIKSMSRLKNKFQKMKLVMVGNGSFTGSSKGGLGHPKAMKWRTELDSLVSELKLQHDVIFAGHLTHEELNALYTAAEVVLVPSKIEGFNLTAVEGWLHRKPCVVSKGAGVSELVHDGVNGCTFNPSDDVDLANKVEGLLGASESAAKMGENGSITARLCDVNTAVKSLQGIFEEESGRYEVK
ncbi:MAG: glycosyltransferase family 4 protein [Thaumarchaeota archaeon]|nr:glycosyltransferase family 4 protein [Nitrososphaerota archaeon]MBI3023556.1 glycosyltransferase family 4 protein [Nitrososphaerota archaeon]